VPVYATEGPWKLGFFLKTNMIKLMKNRIEIVLAALAFFNCAGYMRSNPCREAKDACKLAENYAIKEFPKVPAHQKKVALEQMKEYQRYCRECQERCASYKGSPNNNSYPDPFIHLPPPGPPNKPPF